MNLEGPFVNCSKFCPSPLGLQYGLGRLLLCPEMTLDSKGTRSKIRTRLPPKTKVKAAMKDNKARRTKKGSILLSVDNVQVLQKHTPEGVLMKTDTMILFYGKTPFNFTYLSLL